MEQEGNIVKKGQFYSIYRNDRSDLLLEDKTKRGLEVRERTIDEKLGVESEKGMIYDADGDVESPEEGLHRVPVLAEGHADPGEERRPDS